MAIAFVQGKSAQTGGVTSVAATFDGVTGVGNQLHVMVGWLVNTGDVTTITCAVADGTNTYTENTLRTKTGTAANLLRVESFKAPNTLAAAHTVTATLTGGTPNRAVIFIAEFSGQHLTAPLEDENYGDASSATVLNTGDVIAAVEDGIAFTFILGSGDRTYTEPTGYTPVATAQLRGHAAYRLTPTADTYSATWNISGASSHPLGLHDLYQPPALVPLTTHRPYGPLNTRGINHGF